MCVGGWGVTWREKGGRVEERGGGWGGGEEEEGEESLKRICERKGRQQLLTVQLLQLSCCSFFFSIIAAFRVLQLLTVQFAAVSALPQIGKSFVNWLSTKAFPRPN